MGSGIRWDGMGSLMEDDSSAIVRYQFLCANDTPPSDRKQDSHLDVLNYCWDQFYILVLLILGRRLRLWLPVILSIALCC
jgi:hypothetical protein